MNFSDISLKIRVVSDIHLERYETFDFNNIIEINTSDILCLAGDIGDPFSELYKNFIEWCSLNFFQVLIVTGNHEYYNSSIERSNKKIKDLTSIYCNVIFLNNTSYVINNKIFVGTTLWSYIPENCKEIITARINDYRFIEDFTTEKCNQLHEESIAYIKYIIERYKGFYKIIILSHHSPLLINTSKAKLELLDTNYAFSSDQGELMNDNIDAWIYGHTHYNNNNNYFYNRKTAIISNQFVEKYNKNFYFM